MPIFKEWGNFVNSKVYSFLRAKYPSKKIDGDFIKIPATPRIKDKYSILAKAFWRGKNYQHPYDEITDKVGIRYVLLLTEDVKTFAEIIPVVSKDNNWSYSLDRDFEQEKSEFPFVFDYQSVHYVVKNNEQFTSNSIIIPANTPCEIQIRTLLQHACSELTHDTIYKQEMKHSPNIYRAIAKSRALTESADDNFTLVNKELEKETAYYRNLLEDLKNFYQEIGPTNFDYKSNAFIITSIINPKDDIRISGIREFILKEIPVVKDIILKKADVVFLYSQPIVLLIYYLISNKRENLKANWPLPDSELQQFFIDLGTNMDTFV
jgi:ppGpp synthetase/RelA/SpoT-type nucleotidyltranferase